MSATLELSKFELMWLFEGAAGKSHLRWDVYPMFAEEVFPQLSEDEREFLYTYIKRNTSWLWNAKYHDETAFNYWKQVLARYNPCNQYAVTLRNGKLKETVDAYLWNGKYYTGLSRYCAPEFIVKTEKKPYRKCANSLCKSRDICLRTSEDKEGGNVTYNPHVCDKCDMLIVENGAVDPISGFVMT